MTAGGARERVADFWDDVLADWRPGEEHLTGDLRPWHCRYVGRGDGAVDLCHYPDPYIGDLRGVRSEPRLVFLGLNPGVGYDSLQGDDGTWTGRNPRGRLQDLLNLELYPWHSKKIVGTLRPPVDLVKKYVWDPVQEVPVNEVFAFGRAWFDVCRALELPEIAEWGPDTSPVPGCDMPHWRVSFFRLPSGQLVIVSSQMGSASPPGDCRTQALKRLVVSYRNS